MSELNAQNLKKELWEVLKLLKDNKIDADTADSIASQAREILRTVSVEMRISDKARKPVSQNVEKFAE